METSRLIMFHICLVLKVICAHSGVVPGDVQLGKDVDFIWEETKALFWATREEAVQGATKPLRVPPKCSLNSSNNWLPPSQLRRKEKMKTSC